MRRDAMPLYEIRGEMRWEGVYTVEAKTPGEADAKLARGEWEDWTPTNLCDWEATDNPKEQAG
jgi:hypothetical protein